MTDLVGIITKDNADGFTLKRIRSFKSDGGYSLEESTLLWGVIYQQWVSSGVGEGHRYTPSVKCEFVYEGNNTGRIYFVQEWSDKYVREKQELNGANDIRLMAFGKKKLFKDFFDILNQQFLTQNITKREYMNIYMEVTAISWNIYRATFRYAVRKIFGQEIIGTYVKRAKARDSTRKWIEEILEMVRFQQ
ncbi:MAG: hypothetical protein AABX33_03415 [Nanoarchaeota archaeon]